MMLGGKLLSLFLISTIYS